MNDIMKKIRAIRKAAEDLAEVEEYIADALVAEQLMQKIFVGEPPKRRSGTAAQPV